mgnify:CR=1 FL=1
MDNDIWNSTFEDCQKPEVWKRLKQEFETLTGLSLGEPPEIPPGPPKDIVMADLKPGGAGVPPWKGCSEKLKFIFGPDIQANILLLKDPRTLNLLDLLYLRISRQLTHRKTKRWINEFLRVLKKGRQKVAGVWIIDLLLDKEKKEALIKIEEELTGYQEVFALVKKKKGRYSSPYNRHIRQLVSLLWPPFKDREIALLLALMGCPFKGTLKDLTNFISVAVQRPPKR